MSQSTRSACLKPVSGKSDVESDSGIDERLSYYLDAYLTACVYLELRDVDQLI